MKVEQVESLRLDSLEMGTPNILLNVYSMCIFQRVFDPLSVPFT